MIRFPAFLLAACILAACSGNPFDDSETDTGNEDSGSGDETDPIGGDRGLPPGTTSPSPDGSIVRREARGTGTDEGNGYANSFRYDADDDTFFVEGLAFDGDQPQDAYTNTLLPVGSNFALYEGPETVPDFLTGNLIDQITHRSIYGVSTSGRTRLAIVRTGDYADYGFGGFIYEREGRVTLPTLPTEGQATYSGEYAGLRDFRGSGGLEYVTGSMRVDIDFSGFSGNCTASRCTDAVIGTVSNRQIFDLDGINITSTVLSAINTADSTSLLALPVLQFKVGTGVLDANGEITGEISSTRNGTQFEAGRYYAVMAGDHTDAADGGEIAGIIVVEATDPRNTDVTVRETGGFIVNR